MSHAATNWAIKQRGLKPATKIVLWHLCDRHNPDHGCFPMQSRLAEDCEMSRSTLNIHLQKLEDDGLIRRHQSVDPETKKQLPTRYEFAFEWEGKAVSENRTRGPKAVSGKSQKPCPDFEQSRVRNPDTNSVREPLREPVSAHTRDFLFSEMEEPEKQDETPDLIEDGFNEFWDNIWPSHKRKTGKVDCRKVYRKACEGKHDKAEQVSPADLNMAARRYIASVEDRQYLKGPLPWLRAPGWEPFLAAPEPKPLSFAQRVLRDYGNGGRGSGASAPQVGGPEKNANGHFSGSTEPLRGHSGEPEPLSFAQRVIRDYGRAAE